MPSSTRLVRRLLAGVDFSTASSIVELGPGDGCVTREILRRMRPEARLLALEINPVFVEQCRRINDPRLILRSACASRLPELLEEEGMEKADAVISSLPLAMMDDELVERILQASREALVSDGRFVQYQYSLSDHARVKAHYPSLTLGFTPLNVPPAFVYTCTKRPAEAANAVVRRRRPMLAVAYAGALAVAVVMARAVIFLGGVATAGVFTSDRLP